MFVYGMLLMTLIAYMINGIIGFLLFLFTTAVIISQPGNTYYKLFRLCIVSLPFSFIGVLGIDMSHMLNWTILFNLCLLLYIVQKKKGILGIDKNALIVTFLLYISLLITCAITIEGIKTITEVIQITVMVLTILTIWCNRKSISIDAEHIERLTEEFLNICVITSIGTIIQWLMYRVGGMEIGYVVLTAKGARVICNCLYKGMSVLSIFLGTGAVFVMLKFGTKRVKIVDVLKLGIILSGIVVNTSRTGLVGIAIVFAIYVSVGMIKKKKLVFWVLGILGLIGITIAGYRMALTRGNLFDENGRIATLISGFSIWKESIRSLLFGAGFEESIWIRSESITSHNMLVQSLAQCGAVGTSLFIALFVMYYRRIKGTPYVYVLLYLVVAGMMITDFYANPFTTIILSLIVMLYKTEKRGYRKG